MGVNQQSGRSGLPTTNEDWRAKREAEVAERRRLAEEFYRGDAALTEKQRAEQANGINYHREVEVTTLRKGDVVEQHQHVGQGQGTYFAPPSSDQSTLGVRGTYNQQERKREMYVLTKDTEVLRSTSSDVDNWKTEHTPNEGAELNYGGGVQMVCRHSDKQNFQSLFKENIHSESNRASTPPKGESREARHGTAKLTERREQTQKATNDRNEDRRHGANFIEQRGGRSL